MMNGQKKIVVGLETGFSGGSLSILENGTEIDFYVNNGAGAKTDDLLPKLGELLGKNGLRKREIDLIAVSAKQGSLTGNRIGLAIARGLAASLPAKLTEISLLEAFAFQNRNRRRVVAAVMNVTGKVFCEEFEVRGDACLESRGDSEELTPEAFKTRIMNLKEEAPAGIFCENTLRIFSGPESESQSGSPQLYQFLPDFDIQIVEGNWARLTALAGIYHASDNEKKESINHKVIKS